MTAFALHPETFDAMSSSGFTLGATSFADPADSLRLRLEGASRLVEMTRLGVKLGAEPATFAGLAGVGDLVLTCTGSLSRNRSVGIEIGRGATLSEVLQGRETVAEGAATTESAKALAAREGIEMPIVNAVHRVLFEKQPARWALVELMTRDLKGEHE